MKNIKYIVGVDIASETFAASVSTAPDKVFGTKDNIPNSLDGFQSYVQWLQQQGISPDKSLVCMENTGVYTEGLCYFLSACGYSVVVEAPHKVKRSFDKLTKNDRVDSQQIAEYGWRYLDELRQWEPNDEVFEQIKTLYSTREHLTKQLTANTNALKALKRKVVQTPLAQNSYEQLNKQISENIKDIDKEIQRLIDKNPSLKYLTDLADSVPGVGKALSCCLMVITDGFSEPLDYKQTASLIGIAPHENSSGKSVRRKAHSTQHGHPAIRKLLHLAALSVAVHSEEFREYYLRKVAQGKPPMVVYNNIANKLLKMVFAVVESRTPYIKNYRSINPIYLKSS